MLPHVLLLVLSVFCVSYALAQSDIVSIRSGVHPSYTRLVFDWIEKPGYQVDQKGDRLIMTFDKVVSPDLSSVIDRDLPNIRSVKVLSQEDEALVLQFDTRKGTTFRHFMAGSRVVVDVYNPEGEDTLIAKSEIAPSQRANIRIGKTGRDETMPDEVSKKTPRIAQLSQKKPKPSKPKLAAQDSQKQQEKATKPKTVKEKAKPVQEKVTSKKSIKELALSQDRIDPHVVKVTAPDPIGLAVFQRGNWLWFVIDQKDFSVPPALLGPQKNKFSEFEKINFPDATAFRMLVPEGVLVYGEGGGQLWRIVITTSPRDIKPIETQKLFAQSSGAVRGGTLLWPFIKYKNLVQIQDPSVGDTIHVVTLDDSREFSGPVRRYIEFNTLDSAVGLALVSHIDDLDISLLTKGVAVSSPIGLALSRPEDDEERSSAVASNEEVKKKRKAKVIVYKKRADQIFDFKNWEMGERSALRENERWLFNDLALKAGKDRVEDLLTLAKLNLAHNRGAEAIGFLELVLDLDPEIEKKPEFIALRGASKALAKQYEESLADLEHKSLKKYGEIQYWIAYALAGMERWQEAAQELPREFELLVFYPDELAQELGTKLTETALRQNRPPVAKTVLRVLNKKKSHVPMSYTAALQYFDGEVNRQVDRKDDVKDKWEDLFYGDDKYFRTRAGLDLARFEYDEKKISLDEAIGRIESLRYGWRGDALELEVNFELGKLYNERKDYIKGLSILRDAVSFDPSSDIAKKITDHMTETFQSIFMGDHVKNVSAIQAVTLYDQFTELTPTGQLGDKLVLSLVDRLIEADLLDRAADYLGHLLNHRLKGEEAAEVSLRLAAIYLLDENPEKGLPALDKAEEIFKKEGFLTEDKQRQITLLRIRGLSQIGKPDEGLTILEEMEPGRDSQVLKADISWRSGRWMDAAEALNDLLYAEDISFTRPLTPRQIDYILHRSLALSLANDRVAIAEMRERYTDSMRQTERFEVFEVLTRPRQVGYARNRATINSVIQEVDLFKGFLETYRDATGVSP